MNAPTYQPKGSMCLSCLYLYTDCSHLSFCTMQVLERKVNIDDLITHKLALNDINKAFDLMHAGESIRSVVVY